MHKFMMRAVLACLCICAVLMLMACPDNAPPPGPPVNGQPTVSLSANDYTAYTDQNVTFTASASDPDGDPLTYSWAVDGVPQAQTTSSVIYYWLGNTGTISPEISVTVNDGHSHTATDSVTITVYSASSVRYVNVSSYSIYYIYIRQSGYAWSSDLLGSYVLPNGYVFTVYDIPNDFFAFQADTSGHSLIWVTAPTYYQMQNGYYRNFQLNPGDWWLSGLLNSSIGAPSEASGPSESKPPSMLSETKSGSFACSQIRKFVPGAELNMSGHDPLQPFEATR